MTTNSLLTDSQREFLRLSEEGRREKYSKQQRSYHRKAIRERLRGSIHDFTTIVNHMDPTERKEAVDGISNLYDEVSAVIGFSYIALDDDVERSADGLFAAVAERGIRATLVRNGISVEDVEVDVEITQDGRLDEIHKENHEELSHRELYQLTLAGEITQEEFTEALRKRRGGGVTRVDR